MNFKTKEYKYLSISFCVWLNNLKFSWAQKIDLSHLKYPFCRPLDSAARGWRTTRSPPSYASAEGAARSLNYVYMLHSSTVSSP